LAVMLALFAVSALAGVLPHGHVVLLSIAIIILIAVTAPRIKKALRL
jgi:hypothetical protein